MFLVNLFMVYIFQLPHIMSKIKAQISPFFHRGGEFIKVELPNTDAAKNLIRSVTGRKWSQTHRSWYVPKTAAVYADLQNKFDLKLNLPDEIIKFAQPAKAIVHPKEDTPVFPTFFNIKLPDGRIQKRVTGKKLILQAEKATRFKVFVPFDKKGWIGVIKDIPGRAWNIEESYWSIPYVKQSFRLLKKFIGLQNCQFGFEIRANIPEAYIAVSKTNSSTKKQRPYELLNNQQKEAISKLLERLTLEKRAYSTMKSYRHHLTFFFLYYKDLSPKEISKKQFEQYLLHLIRKKRISSSTQNSVINAVKAYWERVLNRGKVWVDIPRPQKAKKLPNILSVEEVLYVITAPDNLKHKLALMLIYSAGLRRSELLNLLVRDINIKRRAIHIKNSKGQRDRYVTLAESVIPFLEEYKRQYKPVKWLFEGQTGGQYSATSLQKIFRTALNKSKVNPYATLHTLRHSYATHCVENGHNLKAVKLRSPLDDMNLNV